MAKSQADGGAKRNDLAIGDVEKRSSMEWRVDQTNGGGFRKEQLRKRVRRSCRTGYGEKEAMAVIIGERRSMRQCVGDRQRGVEVADWLDQSRRDNENGSDCACSSPVSDMRITL